MTVSDLAGMKDCYLFQGLDREELSRLSGLLSEKSLAEGMTVFVEQMPGESLFVIRKGTIRVSKMISEGNEKTLVILGPEDVFGEMAILDGAARSATARVVESALLLVLRKADFDALCERHPALGLKVMRNIVRVLSQKVRENSQDYREMLLWASQSPS